jgi:hypothetical protein
VYVTDQNDFIAPDPIIPEISDDGVNFTKVESKPSLEPSEESTLALIAHLSILLNLVTGFLGLVPPLIIYLAYKDRSKYVAYQSLQSLIFQAVFFHGAGLLAGLIFAISLALTLVLVGLCGFPLVILLGLIPVGALVYGVVAAVDCFNHRDFKYWLVGDWIRNIYEE